MLSLMSYIKETENLEMLQYICCTQSSNFKNLRIDRNIYIYFTFEIYFLYRYVRINLQNFKI